MSKPKRLMSFRLWCFLQLQLEAGGWGGWSSEEPFQQEAVACIQLEPVGLVQAVWQGA